ncbi:uncharacterized protein TNCV_4465131 [Trichonephila clavipes]|nr:uncharacterized protein TNCV_4465131 [Trichonephila clavipes]
MLPSGCCIYGGQQCISTPNYKAVRGLLVTDLWLATLIAVPLGLGLNPGEDVDVCKCIVPSCHGNTLNSRRAACPLVRLVEGKELWEVPDCSQGVLPLNWGEIKLNCSVT